MKIRPVGAELFHADRRADGQTWWTVGIRNFANAPKNDKHYSTYISSVLLYPKQNSLLEGSQATPFLFIWEQQHVDADENEEFHHSELHLKIHLVPHSKTTPSRL